MYVLVLLCNSGNVYSKVLLVWYQLWLWRKYLKTCLQQPSTENQPNTEEHKWLGFPLKNIYQLLSETRSQQQCSCVTLRFSHWLPCWPSTLSSNMVCKLLGSQFWVVRGCFFRELVQEGWHYIRFIWYNSKKCISCMCSTNL